MFTINVRPNYLKDMRYKIEIRKDCKDFFYYTHDALCIAKMISTLGQINGAKVALHVNDCHDFSSQVEWSH